MSSLLQYFQYRGLCHRSVTSGSYHTYPLFWFESGYLPNFAIGLLLAEVIIPTPYSGLSQGTFQTSKHNHFTGRGSSIGSEFAWHASGPEFDPHVRHILSWRLGHENISTAIFPLPLIQEEQLSVTGERMCTKYW